MKKILLATAVGAAFTLSCSTAKQAQEQRAETYNLKGTWQVSSVDYNKNYKIKPFDEGSDINCFVGSTWTLVPNNGKGSYSLSNNAGCPEVTRNIMFSVTPDKQFAFKKVAEGTKAKENVSGYYLQLQNQTENSFDLVQKVNGTNEILSVVYHFSKVNQ